MPGLASEPEGDGVADEAGVQEWAIECPRGARGLPKEADLSGRRLRRPQIATIMSCWAQQTDRDRATSAPHPVMVFRVHGPLVFREEAGGPPSVVDRDWLLVLHGAAALTLGGDESNDG